LAPTESAIVVPQVEAVPRVVETNITIETLDNSRIEGHSIEEDAYVLVERDGSADRVAATVGPCPQPLDLDGDWEFEAEDQNAFVIGSWLATEEIQGESVETYAGVDSRTDHWISMRPGAWSYQLPAEPSRPYPIPVWYRVSVPIEEMPPHLSLVVDGFAGSDWDLYVNGQPATGESRPSALDSQMRTVDITHMLHAGSNVVALRLTLTGHTDGLLDLVKLIGPFSVDTSGTDARIVPLRRTVQPASWTDQGYPYYSGRGVYRRRVTIPEEYADARVFLQAAMVDDVLEVLVNGRCAGVRLWAPYGVEITRFLQEGENTIELRVANTLVNLLEGNPRASGLAGAPKIVARSPVSLSLESSNERRVLSAEAR
jgi:hypothetical protein